MLKKGCKFVKSIWTPKDTDLHGRGAVIWLQGDGIDMAFVIIYCHVEGKEEDKQTRAEGGEK